jgi:hypothetical protein
VGAEIYRCSGCIKPISLLLLLTMDLLAAPLTHTQYPPPREYIQHSTFPFFTLALFVQNINMQQFPREIQMQQDMPRCTYCCARGFPFITSCCCTKLPTSFFVVNSDEGLRGYLVWIIPCYKGPFFVFPLDKEKLRNALE